MNQHTTDFWTDERIAALRKLWEAQELSASKIARQLGVSKSAVIGKANRLGLHRSPEYLERARTAGAKAGGAATQAKLAAIRATKPKPPPKPLPKPKPQAVEPPAAEWHIPFIHVGVDQCRYPLWPLTARTGLVCGAPSDGRVFCAYHWKRCRVPFPSARKG